MSLFDQRNDQRKDALMTEAHILLSIHNAICAYKAIAWEITQSELADYLQIGERTLQRVSDRLVKMGRLNRSAGVGQSSYVYSVPKTAISQLLIELSSKTTICIIEDPDTGCISFVDGIDNFLSLTQNSIDQNEK